jgi:hypothetical protein
MAGEARLPLDQGFAAARGVELPALAAGAAVMSAVGDDPPASNSEKLLGASRFRNSHRDNPGNPSSVVARRYWPRAKFTPATASPSAP